MTIVQTVTLIPGLALITCSWEGARRTVPHPRGLAVRRFSTRYTARFLVGSLDDAWLDGDKPPEGWESDEAISATNRQLCGY